MTFKKYDGEKPRMELLPAHAVLETGKVMTFGADRYGDNNWRAVDSRGRYVSALWRHLLAYMSGEDFDPDSGLLHVAHISTNALFLTECELLDLGKDTRPTAMVDNVQPDKVA